MSIRNETRWLLFPASALVLSRPELVRIYHGIADISVSRRGREILSSLFFIDIEEAETDL